MCQNFEKEKESADFTCSITLHVKHTVIVKEVLRIKEVADLINMSEGHIYNLCAKNEIPFIRKGRTLYFIKKEIENWLLEGG